MRDLFEAHWRADGAGTLIAGEPSMQGESGQATGRSGGDHLVLQAIVPSSTNRRSGNIFGTQAANQTFWCQKIQNIFWHEIGTTVILVPQNKINLSARNQRAHLSLLWPFP